MMKILGLFLLLITQTGIAHTATLSLRARVPAIYKIEWVNARAHLSTNIVSSRPRLIPSVAELFIKNERIITITHP